VYHLVELEFFEPAQDGASVLNELPDALAPFDRAGRRHKVATSFDE